MKEFLLKYKYKIIFIGIGIYIVIWLFFLPNGFIPTGEGLEKSDWLAFLGDFLSFIGTIFLGVLALWQNNQINISDEKYKTLLMKKDEEHRKMLLESERKRLMPRLICLYKSTFPFEIIIKSVTENIALNVNISEFNVINGDNKIENTLCKPQKIRLNKNANINPIECVKSTDSIEVPFEKGLSINQSKDSIKFDKKDTIEFMISYSDIVGQNYVVCVKGKLFPDSDNLLYYFMSEPEIKEENTNG